VVLTLTLGKEVVKEEALANVSHFIGKGEREAATTVPHIGVRMPVACRTGWSMARRRVPSPGSLTGGPQSVLSNQARARTGVGCTVHRSSSLRIGFLLF
jgi:hypothetical protein